MGGGSEGGLGGGLMGGYKIYSLEKRGQQVIFLGKVNSI